MTNPSVISGQLRKIGYKRYADYLASEHWQTIRREYAESDLPQRCACGAVYEALHHKTYERLGSELLGDLEPVCDACHRRAHGRRSRGKRRKRHRSRSGRVKVRFVDPGSL
jgi:hypothetical protein